MKKNFKLTIILFLIITSIIFCIFLINYYQTISLKKSIEELKVIDNSSSMIISSPVFLNGSQIPDNYGCHGQDINPPLIFSEVPQDAKSLVLLVDDPDAPLGDWVHWLIFNIDPQTKSIAENSVPSGAVIGLNSFGDKNYGGPCPPLGTHRYEFKLYALDTVLNLSSSAEKADIISNINGHIIAQAILTGTYSR